MHQPDPNEKKSRPICFRELIWREELQLSGQQATRKSFDVQTRETLRSRFLVATPGPAAEPWVASTTCDRFGLALSGGGIRSATFNLGLLQGLADLKVLRHLDYLSTVSGGGYVGGFWTAWRYHEATRPRDTGPAVVRCPLSPAFPVQSEKADVAGRGPDDTRERPEFRHLREFSRFLMPRIGFMQAETWAGIVTILAGLVPSLAASLAVLSVILTAWLACNVSLVADAGSPGVACVRFMLMTALVFAVGEGSWRSQRKAEPGTTGTRWFCVWSVVGLVVFFLALYLTVAGWSDRDELGDRLLGSGEAVSVLKLLFAPVAAWLLAAGALIIVRAGVARQLGWRQQLAARLGAKVRNQTKALAETEGWTRTIEWAQTKAWLTTLWKKCGPLRTRFRRQLMSEAGVEGGGVTERRETGVAFAAVDRAIARCLGLAMVWAGFAVVWELCRWLQTASWKIAGAAGGTVATTALFAKLRDWLATPVQPTRGGNWLATAARRLKAYLPRLIAPVAVTGLVVIVGVVMLTQVLNSGSEFALRCWIGTPPLIILLTLLFFDPARLGLHDFYRSRIARCYLGAANPRSCEHGRRGAEQNRFTVERPDDDLTFGELRGLAEIETGQGRDAPIHLVCCAANDLGGDPLGTLYRGARSAVLSPRGISLGASSAELDHLRLSSALTASAAAFNSQMGAISMELGWPVTFLMCALNLRLGLWLPHPRSSDRGRYFLPGQFFFLELLGLTRVAGANIHLSDGAHFENLALYELIRRHCRYIIVSDASADPEVAFDDLANAVRRVREDFGVEVDLDVSPLRPDAAGRSRQHVVVGTIHYDGLGGVDKGNILYFKPTLTGDEPSDVLQYRTRNQAFPHEPTTDQFYDEAQWESYRRLGTHAARAALHFLDANEEQDAKDPKGERFVDNLFLEAQKYWHPAPPGQQEVFLALTGRCAELEADLSNNGPRHLREEFFPEVRASRLQLAKDEDTTPSLDDELKAVSYLMRATQIMEDVWLGADLDNYWSHPLNEGWMNYLQRWASTPSFRRWWPVLRPIYGPGFREFAKDYFQVRVGDAIARPGDLEGAGARLRLLRVASPEELKAGEAWRLWRQRFAEPATAGKVAFNYEMELWSQDGTKKRRPIQVGFVLVREEPRGSQPRFATLRGEEFFVPHALMGGGVYSRMLDALIRHYSPPTSDGAQGFAELRVHLFDEDPKPARRFPGQAARRDRVRDIEFFKSRGFRSVSVAATSGLILVLELPVVPPPPDSQRPR